MKIWLLKNKKLDFYLRHQELRRERVKCFLKDQSIIYERTCLNSWRLNHDTIKIQSVPLWFTVQITPKITMRCRSKDQPLSVTPSAAGTRPISICGGNSPTVAFHDLGAGVHVLEILPVALGFHSHGYHSTRCKRWRRQENGRRKDPWDAKTNGMCRWGLAKVGVTGGPSGNPQSKPWSIRSRFEELVEQDRLLSMREDGRSGIGCGEVFPSRWFVLDLRSPITHRRSSP